MSSIKLKHASGNSMSIAAPATNPASDLSIKLPATIGSAGQVLKNSDTAGTLEFGAETRSGRNVLVNGSMLVSQRGVTGHTSDGYSLDMMYRQQSSDGAFTVSQSNTSPNGFAKSLKVDVTTADTSLASAQYAQIKTKIEAQDLQILAYGTSAAKTLTVSFYVRSNKTGDYGFAIQQSDNSFKQVSSQYTISSADTWERKTITIVGDTSGVINNDTGDGFILLWGLASGTDRTSGSVRSTWTAHASADTYAGQGVNLLDSTSNEWYLTGVQVEVSDYVTDFEHLSFTDELARCKRYFQRYPQGGDGYSAITNGYCNQTGKMQSGFTFPNMKAAPSVTYSGNMRVLHEATASAVGSSDIANGSENSVLLRINSTGTGFTVGNGGTLTQENDTDAGITLSADL